MDESTKILYQKLSLYSGPFFVITFIIFWAWMGDNLPPPHPDWPAQAFTDRYIEHLTGIRIGFLVSLITICFYLPWTGYVTARMKPVIIRFFPICNYWEVA